VKQVLAGDIGGTRARFAVYDASGKKLVDQDVLESRTFATFEAALHTFLKGRGKVAAATFGIAGPVVDQRVKTTNLPWLIDARAISSKFGIPNVTLLNDLVAVGLGALASPPSKLTVLQNGRPKSEGANLAVIAAGTGLGEATFIWDGEQHIACPTEGGHADFAPKNALEQALLNDLAQEHGHVSWERVSSGSSISMIYRFVLRAERIKESRDAAKCIAEAKDTNVAVVELAESKKSKAAVRAIELWSSMYGSEAGNLALKCLASGGLYVAGGVSARLAPIMAKPFLSAFVDKGRMRSLLEKIPVAVALEPRAGLLGAAHHAARTLLRARKK
jgi:glucokinase